jgi:hypothetical protein
MESVSFSWWTKQFVQRAGEFSPARDISEHKEGKAVSVGSQGLATDRIFWFLN